MYIVELEEGCWLAPWNGDPGRTLLAEHAQRFKSWRSAKLAVKRALQFRKFKDIKVVPVSIAQQLKAEICDCKESEQ